MKQNGSISTIGGCALMMIFAVLCLTVFAVLSLSTAKAGDTLSESSIRATQAYYRADEQAERILAGIRRGEAPDGVEQDGSFYSYRCPIDDRQSLYVEVERNGSDYTILRWQAAIDESMIEESGFDLWNEFFEPGS